MITLEEKLTQFEKLINEKIDRENRLKLEEKQQELTDFLNKEKSQLEESAKRTVKLSTDRIDRQKQERISTANQEEKREILKLTEGFVKTLELKLEDRCKEFALGDTYPGFISDVLINLLKKENIPSESKLKLSLAPANFDNTKYLMEKKLKAIEYNNFEIKEGDAEYIGGFVIEIEKLSLRITKTLQNSIIQKREDIGQFMQNYVREGGVN